MKPERRRSPRINLSALAYITFDSNCGGIVVNISDEGLCFHTIAPIERTDTIRFWFSAGGRRIEADGHLMWTDETRKTGGLRFNALSAEAGQQIRSWIVQSSDPSAATRQIAVRPPLDAVARSGISKPAKGATHGSGRLRELSRWIGTPLRPVVTQLFCDAAGLLRTAGLGKTAIFQHRLNVGRRPKPRCVHLGEVFGVASRKHHLAEAVTIRAR